MTVGIILTLCTLILLAYLFDITSSRTRLPPVILLLLCGYLVKLICKFFNVNIPDLHTVLPVLGTVGLVLIVLEGALELELDKNSLPLVKKSFLGSFFPLITMAFGLALVLHLTLGYDFRQCLINAIPLSIISSSIAIPSARNFSAQNREFIIYESSISDILGVIFFNFILYHEAFGLAAFGNFLFQIIIIIIISFLATGVLSFLLSSITNHIKFVPIMSLVILIYETSKVFNLPSLVFILVFGLFLNNLNQLTHIGLIQKLKPKMLRREVYKFKEIATEATFLVRTLFFLLFGFLIRTHELLNTQTIAWAIAITAGIFIIRGIVLLILKVKLSPVGFVAPRGLITILLFLSIPAALTIPLVDRSLITQVILLTALVMTAGAMTKTAED